jgi:hypothetical protein
MSCQKSNVVVGCLDINQTFVAAKTLEVLPTKKYKIIQKPVDIFSI